MPPPAPPGRVLACVAALSLVTAAYVVAAAWPALAPRVPGAVRADGLVTSLLRQEWGLFTRSTDSVRIRAHVHDGVAWRPVPTENVRSLRSSAGLDRSRRAGEWEVVALLDAATAAGAPRLPCAGPAVAQCLVLDLPPAPVVHNRVSRPQVCGRALLVEERPGSPRLQAVPVHSRC